MLIPHLQDPGHGWLAVPVSLIRELGIGSKISAYSYLSNDGETAYLEEDCDALRFATAMRAQGREWSAAPHHSQRDSFVRRLPSWRNVAPLFAADDLPPIPPRVGETLGLF